MSRSGTAVASRLGSQAALVLIGNVFSLAVGFPLQVFVARSLGASPFGVYSLLEGIAAILSQLFGLGIASVLVKFVAEHREKQEYACVRRLLLQGGGLLAVLGAAGGAAMVAGLAPAEHWWPEISGQGWPAVAMAAFIPLDLMSYFCQQGLRGFQEIRYMVVGTSILPLLVKAIVAVVLLTLGYALLGYVVAVLAGALAGLLWMAFELARLVGRQPRGDDTPCRDGPVRWMRYAGVMYSNSLINIGTAYLDRFLLGLCAGAGPVGVLAVVKQLQNLPARFLVMFLAVVAPMFSAAHARGDRAQAAHLYHLSTDWLVRASLPLLFFLALFAEPLLALYGPDFAAEGTLALWLLVAAQILNLGSGPVGNLLNMCGEERAMLRIGVWETVLTMLALAVLVPAFALPGTCASLALGTLFANSAGLYLAAHRLGIRWWDARFGRWLLPGALTVAAGLWLRSAGGSALGAFGLIGSLVVLYAVFHGTFLFQGLHEDDRELLRHVRTRFGLAPGG